MINLIQHLKPPKVQYEAKNKAKGKGGSANMARNKKIVQEAAKKVMDKYDSYIHH